MSYVERTCMYNFDQFLDRTLLVPVVKHEARVFDMSSQMKNNNNNNKTKQNKTKIKEIMQWHVFSGITLVPWVVLSNKTSH